MANSPFDANGRANRAYISRSALTVAESAAPMTFEVALTMRNFDELEARLAHSEIIPASQMSERYLPLAKDYARVRRWLESAGFAVTRTDANRLAVFAQGSVKSVATEMEVTFARVTSVDGEFTSAITAPTVPSHLASAIRGIHGLQPEQRLHLRPHVLTPLAGTGSSIPYYPNQIAIAYRSAPLGLSGAGQTIAIYALAYPQSSDLSAFWSATGVTAVASNIQHVDVAGGPATTPSTGASEEATLDVEWASALAPGAKVRIYAASENNPVADDELIQQVLADLPSNPSIHQLSISFGADENAADRDYIAIEAQYMATLVASGVTVFASSGDYGALDNEKSSVQTSVPASMPDVTAVGGTTLHLDSSSNILTEVAWGNSANAGTTGSTGGGISAIFNRPSWQNITGAISGATRLVPDVAAVGDPQTGAYLVYGGRTLMIGGTSLSSPLWAAWCAQMNQGRTSAGKQPLGALNPRIYPLAATAAFNDIVSGGNSVYQAHAGYDLCTGIGTPNIGTLYAATLADSFAPVIEAQSGDRFTVGGQGATFYVVATGSPNPTFLWQRLPTGSSSWVNLSDDGIYSGTSTYALIIKGASPGMNGDQFRCIVANSFGSVTAQPATLTVAAGGVSTFAGWPGWSGFADGQGSAGRFNYTGSVRTDLDGNVYVADASNNTIRKITPDGVVSTVAGAPGVSGSTDGSAASARFNGPAGVAIDAAGNLFVADSQNYTIRKITPAGIVSTIAGNAGVQGHADGTGRAANFYDPQNLAVDSAGNIYVADGKGNSVRKVTPSGVVTTLAGSATAGTSDGTGATAHFNLLAGIAVDGAGNVYVGDFLNNAVRKITPVGVVTTLAGLPGAANLGFADGNGSSARFDGPTGLAVDSAGNVYVADSYNNAIREISPTGTVSTLAGSPTQPENIDGTFSNARFNEPADVAVDTNGAVYVADSINCTVRRITFVPTITGSPQGQTVIAGNSVTLAVSISGTGPFAYQWYHNGIAITGANGTTYTISNATIASEGTYTVTATTPTGTFTSTPAVVTVGNSSASHLANLSARSMAGSGAQTLIVGFVLSGSSSKTLLIRGIGPGLGIFHLTGTLPNPVLTVYGPDSSTMIAAQNDNWNLADGTTMTAVGAFGLTPGSNDAAVVATFGGHNYTAEVTEANGESGIGLAEIYDTAPDSAPHLANLSARSGIGTDAGILIAGFVISGTAPKTVLIRGVGPSLSQLGVTGTLADPRLDLFDHTNTIIASNDDWGGDAQLVSAFNRVGAFGYLAGTSKDAALLITLQPGNYTAQVSGVNGTTGVGLVEIYDLP